jgi:hypothetical protein
MISLPAGHQTQPAKVLSVSAERMLPLAVARWVSKSSNALAAFVTNDESTIEGLLVALPRSRLAALTRRLRACAEDRPGFSWQKRAPRAEKSDQARHQ